jgi:hypothetical protein
MRLFKNVVRGFSLVLHDPKESHYKSPLSRGQDLEVKNNKCSCGSLDPQGEAKASPLRPKLE